MKKSLLFILAAVFIISCKKNGHNNDITTVTLPDELTDEQIQLMVDAGIDTTSTFADAKFADGTSMNDWLQSSLALQKSINNVSNNVDTSYSHTHDLAITINGQSDEKHLFIAAMTAVGLDLTKHANQYPGQIKLAYVYNSKDVVAPTIYPGAACQQPKYGLDCSGMIYQMAYQSTLNLPKSGTATYASIQTWNTAFKNTAFASLQMTDMGALPVVQLEAGDIVVSPGNHMGMVFDNGSNKGVLNSLGSPNYSCDKNSGVGYGPIITENISKWLTQNFGSKYHVLRTILKGTTGLTTSTVSNITPVSATSGGNITNQGDSPVTSRGVCWNTTGTPTIGDSKTTDGSGTGTFVSNLAALKNNTTYYVRAYAVNSTGVGYGQVKTFQTGSSGNPTGGYYVTFNVNGAAVAFAQNQIRQTTSFGGGPYGYNGYLTPIIDNVTDIEFQSDGTNLEFELLTPMLPSLKTYTQTDSGQGDILTFEWEYHNTTNDADYSYALGYKNSSATVTITSISNGAIKGTFSATLVYIIDGTSTVNITNGQFFVPYQ